MRAFQKQSIILCTVVFSLTLLSSPLPTKAAGSDSPFPEDSQPVAIPDNSITPPRMSAPVTPQEPPPVESQRSPQPGLNVLNWQYWSKPYLRDGLICRDYNGNIICVSPDSAKRMLWN